MTPLTRTAFVVSHILHPAVLLVVAIFLLGVVTQSSLGLAILATGIFVLGLLPGLLYHARAVGFRQGKTYHDDPHYHRFVLPLFLGGLLMVAMLYWVVGVHPQQIIFLMILITTITGGIVINRFSKMSFHAAVSMSCALIFLPFSWTLVAVGAACSLLVGLSRLPLRRHSWAQVVAGWIYGASATALLLLLVTG